MSTCELAKRLNNFSESPTSVINTQLDELRRSGKKIISLNIGEPDFTSPDYIKVAGIKAITDGFTKYTRGNGILELRTAIAEKLEKENNVKYTTDEICVTNGAKQAVSCAVMAVCGLGDEVIIPIPCWVSYTDIVRLAEAEPVLVPCKSDYSLDLAAIEAAITPRTKAIIICTLNNPSGAVYSEESLRALGDLAIKYDFFVIVDEIYEKLVYDGYEHFSIASASPEVWKRTITVNGLSKAYAMTGWRQGYVAARKDIISGIQKIISQTTSSTCSIAQKAAFGALVGPQDDTNHMVDIFRERRDFVYQRISAMPNISCVYPHGAFYLLVDIERYLGKCWGDRKIQNASDLTEYLLTEALVSVVPGDAYNIPGKIRISYSNSMENLKTALDKMEEALVKLQ